MKAQPMPQCRYDAPAENRTRVTVEPVFDRQKNCLWVAHGTINGIPFVAESTSRAGAISAARALLSQTHPARLRANSTGNTTRQPNDEQ